MSDLITRFVEKRDFRLFHAMTYGVIHRPNGNLGFDSRTYGFLNRRRTTRSPFLLPILNFRLVQITPLPGPNAPTSPMVPQPQNTSAPRPPRRPRCHSCGSDSRRFPAGYCASRAVFLPVL